MQLSKFCLSLQFCRSKGGFGPLVRIPLLHCLFRGWVGVGAQVIEGSGREEEESRH